MIKRREITTFLRAFRSTIRKGFTMEIVLKSMRLFLFITFACIATECVATAQPCAPLVTLSHATVQQLSFADIDFQHFRSNSILFTLHLTDPTPQATLQITLDIELADLSRNFSTVIDYRSDPFRVPAEGKTITNLDLGNGGSITGNLTFDQEAKDYLKDATLGTGTFPAGRYTFHFTVTGVSTCTDNVVLVLENPSRVELRAPRDGESTNEFPLFEFYQESNHAVLTIAEKNPEQSNEDAITRKPPMIEQELTGGQNSFLYSGGRPLEIGKTYVWQVVTKVSGSGGKDNEVVSQIWSFTVSSEPDGGASTDDAILNQLKEIFGPRYPTIFEQIRSHGFALTGNNNLNGSALSQAELLNLINQLRQMSDSAELSFE